MSYSKIIIQHVYKVLKKSRTLFTTPLEGQEGRERGKEGCSRPRVHQNLPDTASGQRLEVSTGENAIEGSGDSSPLLSPAKGHCSLPVM